MLEVSTMEFMQPLLLFVHYCNEGLYKRVDIIPTARFKINMKEHCTGFLTEFPTCRAMNTRLNLT